MKILDFHFVLFLFLFLLIQACKKPNESIFINKQEMDTLNSAERFTQNIRNKGVVKVEAYKYMYIKGKYEDKGRYVSTQYFNELGRIIEEENSDDMVLIFKYSVYDQPIEYYSHQRFYQYWNDDYKLFSFKYVNKFSHNGLLIETDTYNGKELIQIELREYDDKKYLTSSKKQTPKGKLLSKTIYEYNAKGFISKLSNTMYPSITQKYLENYHKDYFYNSNNLIEYVIVYKGDNIQYKVVYEYDLFDDKSQPNKTFEDFAQDFVNNASLSYDNFKSYCDTRIYTTNCENGEKISVSIQKAFKEIDNGWLKRSKYNLNKNEIEVHIDEFYTEYFSFRKKGGKWKLYYYMGPC